jgi:hypothetical protein
MGLRIIAYPAFRGWIFGPLRGCKSNTGVKILNCD